MSPFDLPSSFAWVGLHSAVIYRPYDGRQRVVLKNTQIFKNASMLNGYCLEAET